MLLGSNPLVSTLAAANHSRQWSKLMRALSILGELLPVLGTVGLLGLWLYQQTQIEQRSDQLRKLASSRTVYQIYQSHNAVFNAINVGFGKQTEATNQLRTFQTYNYELGLAAIEKAFPEGELTDIPGARYTYDSS